MGQVTEKDDVVAGEGNVASGLKISRSRYVPQFCRFLRFERLEKSISSVFSIPLNIPTPPASILYLFYIVIISYYRDLDDRTRRLYDFLMQPMQL